MDSIVYEKRYEIHSYDTGTNGKLRPDALLSFLQDIAGHHATILNVGRNDLLERKRFWALIRIVCKLDYTPRWNEEIIIKTWPRGIEKILAIRNFIICLSDGEVIGEASSSWVVVDKDSRRPVRPDANLAELGTEDPYIDFSCPNAVKLPGTGDNAYRSDIKLVRYSDLDVNMHVNNARYMQWILDSYPLDFVQNNEVSEIEANYNSETTPGQKYIVTAEERDNSFYHSVIKEDSGMEACIFRIRWKS